MTALRVILPLALVALCLALTDARGTLARLGRADPLWLGTGMLTLTAVTLLSALRWRITAAALGLAIPAGEAVREYYLAQIVNQTLPGGVLGDVARAARSRRHSGLKLAVQAVVLERAAGQAAMFALLASGLALSPPLAARLPPVLIALALALPAGLVLALRLRPPRADPAGWRAAARRALLAIWPLQAGLSLAIALLTLAAFAAAARATGTALSPLQALWLGPAVLTAMLLPASVGGWGWREGAAAALFPLAGATGSAGLAASLAYGLTVLASALPGTLFLLRTSAPRPALRPARPLPRLPTGAAPLPAAGPADPDPVRPSPGPDVPSIPSEWTIP